MTQPLGGRWSARRTAPPLCLDTVEQTIKGNLNYELCQQFYNRSQQEVRSMTLLNRVRTSQGFWICVVIVILYSIFFGPATYRQWKAGKLVDELYAKDGGVKVYETIELPDEMFNSGAPKLHIQDKEYMKADDDYYYFFEPIVYITPENRSFGSLNVCRTHSKLYRAKDNKLLGERIGYFRTGGAPKFLPVHPPSYSVGENDNIEKLVFIKKNLEVQSEPA